MQLVQNTTIKYVYGVSLLIKHTETAIQINSSN